MSNTAEYALKIIRETIQTQTKRLPSGDYLEVLEEIESDMEAMIAAFNEQSDGHDD